MIEGKNQEVTYEALLTVLRVIWRLSGAGKDAEFKEKELNLANPRSFANGKTCFYCGSIDHMRCQCPKSKAGKGRVECTYPVCPAYGHRREDCWEYPKNANKKCSGWVSGIKKPDGEAES